MSTYYLDCAASTRLDERVLEVLKKNLNNFGNPSSQHPTGRAEREIIENIRSSIKKIFQAKDVVFLSGATEANNTAIRGIALANKKYGKHIILGPTEHDSARQAAYALQKEGFEIEEGRLKPDGSLDIEYYKQIIREDTILIIQMMVSNLFGTIYEIEQLAEIMKQKSPHCRLHVDAVQAVGKVKFHCLDRTTYAISGHKIHAPKGIGALIGDCKGIEPLIVGGGQENGLRSGTENVLGIIGLGKAIELLKDTKDAEHYATLYDEFVKNAKNFEVVNEVNSTKAILAVKVKGAPAEVYMHHLASKGVYVSVGSACQSREKKIGTALKARGFSTDEARQIMRISFGRDTKVEEVQKAAEILNNIAEEFLKNFEKEKPKEKPKEKQKEKPKSTEEVELSEKSTTELPNLEKTNDNEEKKHKVDFNSTSNIEPPKKKIKLSRKERRKERREKEKKQLKIPGRSSSEFGGIIIRYGEIALKGNNAPFFYKKIADNAVALLKPICPCTVKKVSGRIFITPKDEKDMNLVPKLVTRLQSLLGVISISPVIRVETDEEVITKKVVEFAKKELEKRTGPIVFRVSCNRQGKHVFPKSSQEMAKMLGAKIKALDPTRFVVNLKNPEWDVGVDIRDVGTFIYTETVPGPGGIPSGCAGRAMVLLSGGIDSPVASYMMMKRGCTLSYIAFWSYPYIGEKLVDKIKALVKHLAIYQPTATSKLYMIPFGEIQVAIRDKCDERYRNILYRRAMNKIANRVAGHAKAKALVTGESLSQVASQTLSNMSVIEESSEWPVLRPVIGMDKIEIINIAKKIGTYEISSIEQPDCCTLFQPRAPITYGDLKECLEEEKKIENYEELIQNAIKGLQLFKYSVDDAE